MTQVHLAFRGNGRWHSDIIFACFAQNPLMINKGTKYDLVDHAPGSDNFISQH